MRTKHQIKCQQCGTIFEAIDTRRKFCSEKCSTDRYKGQIKRTETFACKNCGKQFRPKVNDRNQYCSRECAFEDWGKYAAINKAEKERERIESWPKCRVCGKPVKKHRNKLCSIECEKQEAREKAVEYGIGKHIIKKRVCKECGKEFYPEYRDHKRRFCSKECLKTYTHREGKHIRRARKKTQTVEIFTRKEIYERDKWICRICGKPIHKTKHVPHPLSPTIDHIIPLACGGSHERKNVQAAHFICNSVKGDRAGKYGDQMRLI